MHLKTRFVSLKLDIFLLNYFKPSQNGINATNGRCQRRNIVVDLPMYDTAFFKTINGPKDHVTRPFSPQRLEKNRAQFIRRKFPNFYIQG